jgi:hypothetical protein
MRACFPPTPLHVAVLLGWTVYGAVRERLAGLEARLRRRPAAVEAMNTVAHVGPPRPGPPPARPSAARSPGRPDYSLN